MSAPSVTAAGTAWVVLPAHRTWPAVAARRIGERAVQTIGAQQWLDAPGYTLEHGLALTFALLRSAGRPLQDLLHGTWLGHPLHPALTDVPLGAWTAALALDGVDLLSARPPGFRQAAQTAVGFGIVGGVGAALTGVTDWQHTHEQARRTGLVHGALNTVGLALFVLSWQDRRAGRLARGRLAGAAGYGLGLASSYLGGALVFRHGLGVDHGSRTDRPADFTAVLPDGQLEADAPRRVPCGADGVVLVRHAGEVVAVGDRCPHLGAPLGEGWVYRDGLVCPWHGSIFDLHTGEVVRGPAVAPLARYQTREREGQIEVRPGPAEATSEPGRANGARP